MRYSLPLSLADKTYSAAEELIQEAAAAERPNDVAPASDDTVQKGKDVEESHDGIQESEDEEDYTLEGPKDFNHPASVEAQRTIWIPGDMLGLAKEEVEDLQKKNILASTDNATMNAKGQVDIQGRPPGEPELD